MSSTRETAQLLVQGPQMNEVGELVRSVGASGGQALGRQYHLDRQGGVQATTTGAAVLEAQYGVDAWGNVLSGDAPDSPLVALGGLGYWQEPDLGLNYVRARWLDPQMGSWLSVDPVTSEPRYSYAHNSPTRFVDPLGQQGVDPLGQEWDNKVITSIMQELGLAKEETWLILELPDPLFVTLSQIMQLQSWLPKELTLAARNQRLGGPNMPRAIISNGTLVGISDYISELIDKQGQYRVNHPEYRRAYVKYANIVKDRKWQAQQKVVITNIERSVRNAGKRGRYPIFDIGGIGTWRRLDTTNKVHLVKALLGPYEHILRLSARKNCIPMWLLSTVIVAELMDVGLKDHLEEFLFVRRAIELFLGHSPSIGLGQLQIDRAMRSGSYRATPAPPQGKNTSKPKALVDVGVEDLRYLGLPDALIKRALGTEIKLGPSSTMDDIAARNFQKELQGYIYQITADHLSRAQYAIEAVARELSSLLEQLLNAPANYESRKYFIKNGKRSINTAVTKIKQQRCNNPDILIQVDWLFLKPSKENVVQMMHTLYNSPSLILGASMGGRSEGSNFANGTEMAVFSSMEVLPVLEMFNLFQR